ncbi:hypothetical protein BASA82_000243 [Batrachochytrium salamandrivorans]|nr:hypothetical protein BASA81_002141 [Batrachochytrium salamandrivorans]KAH9262722.1 hypothetical protein BASA82_000243 [Batrachochytrium salamandrivorans]
MDAIPTSVKIAAVTLGASYLVGKELNERLALTSDLALVKSLGKYKANVSQAFANKTTTTDFWYTTYDKQPQTKRAIVFCEEDGLDRVWTFHELEQYSNQVAHFLIAHGLQENDTIALFMENRPEFIGTWLGATKVGVKIAMINTSIVMKGLAHCISVSGAKGVVYGSELEQALMDAQLSQENASLLWSSDFLGKELGKYPTDSGADRFRHRRTQQSFSSHWGFIYTSGTTGLPKAANILHAKMYAFGGGVTQAFGVTDRDTVYTCLPLFHSAGGGLGAGMMIMGGATLVLRRKFSAKAFFPDCVKYKVTVAQYIGELCRYLLASPVNSEFEKKHTIRVAIGNGLRPEIWGEFKQRFNIPEVGEFYGSTEGNGALFNHNTTTEGYGAVGRLGFLLKRITGMKLAKYDVERDELVRDKVTGLCVEAEVGQPGELLMPIRPEDPSTQFAGYSDAKATEKKMVRNGFTPGDCYFSTGDLLSRDAKGYYRFVDRIGDTFRWKGENCSTTEVTEVVSIFPGVDEANVYGVQVPNNQDGRAPCAAITFNPSVTKFDFAGFLQHCTKNLPSYAVPLFIRVTPAIAVTATLKHQKGDLRSEGIDISKVKDAMYYWNDKEGYVLLTPQVYAKITTPGARL